MQYAGHLPHPPQVFVVGAVALLVGAGGATAIAAIADNDVVVLPDVNALVTPQASATHNEGSAATGVAGPVPEAAVTHSETATAAGIAAGSANSASIGSASGKDEAATAAALGG